MGFSSSPGSSRKNENLRLNMGFSISRILLYSIEHVQQQKRLRAAWVQILEMMALFIIVLLIIFSYVDPRICNIGYGQRGLRFQNEIIWQRNCKETDYCFEAVTSEIEKMKPLIDYPWVRILSVVDIL